MPNPIITTRNFETGEEITRPMTDAEFEQYEKDREADAIHAAEMQSKIDAKQSAMDKLTALGLTTDEVAALIP